MSKPYTYMLHWNYIDKGYYGCRWANKLSAEEDLGRKYFTSSKVVRKMWIEDEMCPDIIIIDKEFSTNKQCQMYELMMLKLLDVRNNSYFLNKTDNFWRSTVTGRKLSEEHKEKIRATRIGKKRTFSKEHRENISKARKGKRHTIETRRKIGDAHIGRIVSEETRRRLAEAILRRHPPRSKKIVIDGREFTAHKEAAEFLNVARPTFYKWIRSGKLKNIKDNEYTLTK